jgi:hypothetical protein
MLALLNIMIMLRNRCKIIFNIVLSLAVHLLTTGILSMVPITIASVQSRNVSVCATKCFYYVKKHIYNRIELQFKPGGVSIHYGNTINAAL